MTNILSVSVTKEEYAEVQSIKVHHGIGASQIFRFGIKGYRERLPYKLEQMSEDNNLLKQQNEKLILKVNNLARKVFELEQMEKGE